LSENEGIPIEQRVVLKHAAGRLATEFEGSFGSETIELFLTTYMDTGARRSELR